MEQRIHQFEVRFMGDGEAADHEIPVQINLFDRHGDTIGYLKFLSQNAGTREHQCDTHRVTVWYRNEQFDSVLQTLTAGQKSFVFCRGPRDSGIRVES